MNVNFFRIHDSSFDAECCVHADLRYVGHQRQMRMAAAHEYS